MTSLSARLAAIEARLQAEPPHAHLYADIDLRCKRFRETNADDLRLLLALARRSVEALTRVTEAFALTLSEKGTHWDHDEQTDPDTMCLDCWEVREARQALADLARMGEGGTK